MLQNAYFLATIGADTAENEEQFAEILPIDRRVAARAPGGDDGGDPSGGFPRGHHRHRHHHAPDPDGTGDGGDLCLF